MNDEIQELNAQIDGLLEQLYYYFRYEFPDFRDIQDEEAKNNAIDDLEDLVDSIEQIAEQAVDLEQKYEYE